MTNPSQAAIEAETFDAIHRLILENPHLMRIQGIGMVKAALDKAAADATAELQQQCDMLAEAFAGLVRASEMRENLRAQGIQSDLTQAECWSGMKAGQKALAAYNAKKGA